MAVQQPASKIFDAPASYWADDVDAPIRLACFPCCGRYVCRCDDDDEEDRVAR